MKFPRLRKAVAVGRWWAKVRPIRRIKELTSERIEFETTEEGHPMNKVSKALGAVVGGALGLLAAAVPVFGFLENPAVVEPIVDTAVVLLMTYLGTYFAPKNAE
jgi:hypothetical protein